MRKLLNFVELALVQALYVLERCSPAGSAALAVVPFHSFAAVALDPKVVAMMQAQ